ALTEWRAGSVSDRSAPREELRSLTLPARFRVTGVPAAMRNWLFVISRRIWQTIRPAVVLVDQGLVALATLFGVTMPTPGQRFAVFFGVYAVLYLLASLPIPLLSLTALVIAYAG